MNCSIPLEPRRLTRLVFAEVAQGYSSGEFKGKVVYIKHFSQKDFGLLEYEYEKGHLTAQEAGLPTLEEKKKLLSESGDWSVEEEERFSYLSKKLQNIDNQLDQIFLESQKKELKQDRFKVKEELGKLEEGRELLVTNTCEDYGNKKYAEAIAVASLFTDESLKTPLFSKAQYEEMTAQDFIEIIKFFNNRTEHLSQRNFQRVAASPYFLNTFIYVKNQPFFVFGRSTIDLTVNQVNVFLTAIQYKDILEKGKSPPQHTYSDIDALVDWYEGTSGSAQGAQKESKMTAENQGSALVGATKEELQDYAAATDGVVVDLKKELDDIKKKKGKVGAAEFAEVFDKYK